MAILGINNNPYFDMESYVDMSEFDRLQPEIIRGFAEAREFAKEGTWMKPGFTFEQMSYKHNWKPIYQAMEEFMELHKDDPIYQGGIDLFKDFTNYKQRNKFTRYLKMAMGAYEDAKNGINNHGPHRNEFIHIRPNTKKAFYIWDPEHKNKIYLNTRAAWWNDNDWHGGEKIMEQSYSLRIDGKFTEDFRKKLCISHLETY